MPLVQSQPRRASINTKQPKPKRRPRASSAQRKRSKRRADTPPTSPDLSVVSPLIDETPHNRYEVTTPVAMQDPNYILPLPGQNFSTSTHQSLPNIQAQVPYQSIRPDEYINCPPSQSYLHSPGPEVSYQRTAYGVDNWSRVEDVTMGQNSGGQIQSIQDAEVRSEYVVATQASVWRTAF